MARDDWVVGGDRRKAAAERIYDVATDLIAREGPEAFDIETLAARVHCSRATIYRYAGGKADIRDAVVARSAARIVETVRQTVENLRGPERVVTAITVALQIDSVRSIGPTHVQLDPGQRRRVAHRVAAAGRFCGRAHWVDRPRPAGRAMGRPCGDVTAVLARR